MGAAGRRLVEKHFGVAAWGPRLAAAIDAVARDVQHCRCLGLASGRDDPCPGDSQGGTGWHDPNTLAFSGCWFADPLALLPLARMHGCVAQTAAVLPERFGRPFARRL